MRRVQTFTGQQVYEWFDTVQAQLSMVGLSKLSAAVLGTSGAINGLTVSPGTGLTVNIAPGEVYQVEPLEATACGTLPANTTYNILKQGIQLATVASSTLAAPTTSGQSINYLIEVQYQDLDLSLDPTTGVTPLTSQFYNATNPVMPWSGPNNNGASSNTFRDGVVAIQVVAGTAATTGTQTTPAVTSGWIGIAVVTVAYGAASISGGNIAAYTNVPNINTTMLGLTPQVPTPGSSDNSLRVANTAWVALQGFLTSALAGTTYAPIASPTFTGTPIGTNAPTSDNTTKIATTAWIWTNIQTLVSNCIAAVATAAGFAYSFGASGYIKFPSWLGGWVAQWIATSSWTSLSAISWPSNFPNNCYAAFPASSDASNVIALNAKSTSTVTIQKAGTGTIYILGIGN